MPEDQSTSEFTLVEQAMGNPPGWLMHWGITVIVVFLGVVVGIMAVVQYPDAIQAEASTYIDKPPIDLFPPKPGVVHAVLVADQDTIAYHTPLIVLESTADWKTICRLDSLLQQDQLPQANLSPKVLGVLNEPYQKLLLLALQIKDADQTNITALLKKGTLKEIEQNKVLNASLQAQIAVFQQEIDNIAADLKRSRRLVKEGSISQREFEQKENEYLQSKRALHQMESNIISNNIRINQLEREIPISNKQQHDLLFQLENDFQQQKERLQALINQWKKEHILCAKASGKIALNNDLQQGRQLQSDQRYGTLMPFIENKKSYVKANIPALGSGKITPGQQAIVYLNSYPSAEYGTLHATVVKVAPIPTEKEYEVLLVLPDDWVTNYGKAIPKQHNLLASVAIQTKAYSLLERVFASLMDAVTN